MRKDNIRVEAYGTVDELNSLLGVVRSYALPEQAQAWLEEIQNKLFVIGADLATPMDSSPKWLVRLDDQPVLMLENAIDQMDEELPAMNAFILPGGVTSAAMLHVARTVCRRAERICVTLAAEEAMNAHVLVYLNRLSDFLFTLARWVNLKAGETETKWHSRG